MTSRISQGHIRFDELATAEFVDLVQQTLESSDFIETEWEDIDGETEDVLVVHKLERQEAPLDA